MKAERTDIKRNELLGATEESKTKKPWDGTVCQKRYALPIVISTNLRWLSHKIDELHQVALLRDKIRKFFLQMAY